MNIAAVIVAAGRGLRAGAGVPKQWRPLAGRPVAEHALRCFLDHPQIGQIVMVVHPEDMAAAPWPKEPAAKIVEGGATRGASVMAGLKALDSTCTHVLIHDAARPCVTTAIIDRVITALEISPAAAPGIPVVDALWTGAQGHITGTSARDGLYRAQTPQGFDLAALMAAYRANPQGGADDVEVAFAAGLPVALVDGDEDNLKITTADDFHRAEQILRSRNGH